MMLSKKNPFVYDIFQQKNKKIILCHNKGKLPKKVVCLCIFHLFGSIDKERG